jgi:hypothetical protein
VAVWRLAVGIELDEGGRAYEEVTRASPDIAVLRSKDRAAALHFDLARALVQDGARRDAEAIQHVPLWWAVATSVGIYN